MKLCAIFRHLTEQSEEVSLLTEIDLIEPIVVESAHDWCVFEKESRAFLRG